jgi:predicted RNA-binding Zn ribbon-like protein
VEICFETENDASPEEIARVQALLAEVSVREVPDSLYQQRIASSSSRSRSELGLLRILTEASMSLELRVEGERVYLEAQSSSLNLAPTRTSGAKLAAASKESGSR